MRDMAADIFGREKRAEREGYRKGAGGVRRGRRAGRGKEQCGTAGRVLDRRNIWLTCRGRVGSILAVVPCGVRADSEV